MIKVKLSDNTDIKCFGVLLLVKDMLRDYSIDITDSDDYDYEFVSGREFVDLSLPLQESIDWGIGQLSKKSGDYFIFHAGDSPQIMGAYEVFIESDAKYMFKKYLMTQEDYKIPSIIGKWWFGTGSALDKGYDIPDDVYSRMKLQGYNVPMNWTHLQKLESGSSNRDIDVCAIYRGILDMDVYDHEVKTDVLYTKHRNGSWIKLSEIENKYNIVKGNFPYDKTDQILSRSKMGVSPFGMAELCYRDMELTRWGCLILKPDMDRVIAEPNWLRANETYLPVKMDWSDLNETVEKVLGNMEDYQYIIDNARKRMIEACSYENVCLHWYDFFANLGGVENE